MAKIKREDEVIVIAGRDKGKRGTVRQVLDTGKLIVSGINRRVLPAGSLRRKHQFRFQM
jgi:ribosomal protein L24